MHRSHALAALLVASLVLTVPAATAQEFFGTYSGDGERFDGSYLSSVDAGNRIADVACQDNLLFEHLGVDVDEIEVDGASLVASGPNATVQLHDTPTCHIKVVAEQAVDVEATVADPTEVRSAGDRIELERGVAAGFWSPDGEVAAGDGTVTVTLKAGETAMLRVRPGGGSFPAMSARPTESRISDAVETGNVGAEAFVQGGPRPGHAVSVFADLTVDVEQGDAVNLTVADDGDEPTGKVVVARVDDLALSGDGDVQVAYDGEPIPAADGIGDVLDPHDDGLQAEQQVVSLDGSHVVLVSVPHFSEHTITIDKVVEFVQENPQIAAVAVLGALTVVGLAAGGMFAPRKR